MAIGWHRPTKLIIDTTAIKENVLNEVNRLPEDVELFAVVKADGYGHGAVESAKAAKVGGATGFCVAILDEAIELREAGITDPILILSVVNPAYLELVLKYDLSITVATLEWLEEASQHLMKDANSNALNVHLKVDTGMGRIGFTDLISVQNAISFIQENDKMKWEGIFTHFSTADEKDNTYYETQAARFKAVLASLKELPKYIHVGNSATALWHAECLGNMIRYGIAMYGLNPSGTLLPDVYELKPALSLVSELIQVKSVPAGQGIGYGKTYVTEKEEWIGTIPIGYADGWLRHLQGFSVLVNGEKCEIIGRICMDQCMIRLKGPVEIGTTVTLIGKNGQEIITAQMVAEKLATIQYEVVCMFSERVPRVYKIE